MVAVCPDDGAESLPHRLDREQFGVIALDHPAEPGHEGTRALGVLGELLVLEPDQVADPGTVLAASEVDDTDPPVVDDPVARLVVAVREVEADWPWREAGGPFPQGVELGSWHEARGFGDPSADGGECLLGVSVRDLGWRLQPG
jgi:hypothetical protein